MNDEAIIEAARRHLADAGASLFSDEELSSSLTRVTRDYCIETGAFKARCPIYLDAEGRGCWPPDFGGLVSAFNAYGERIRMCNSREVADKYTDFLDVAGPRIEFIYDDLTDDAHYRVCPTPPQEHVEYGDMGPGMYTQFKGTAFGWRHGACACFKRFSNVGSFTYRRVVEPEHVRDHVALVYGVVARALEADTDFSDTARVDFYRTLYRQRTGFFKQVRANSPATAKHGEFF